MNNINSLYPIMIASILSFILHTTFDTLFTSLIIRFATLPEKVIQNMSQ